MLSATFDMIVARRKLEEAAVDRYGKAAWESAGRKYGMKQQPKDLLGVLKSERTSVAIDGDNATVTSEDGKPERLVRRDGIWRVTGEGLPRGETARRSARAMQGLAGAMRMTLAEIERGATADAVRRKMLMDVLKAVATPAIESMKEGVDQSK